MREMNVSAYRGSMREMIINALIALSPTVCYVVMTNVDNVTSLSMNLDLTLSSTLLCFLTNQDAYSIQFISVLINLKDILSEMDTTSAIIANQVMFGFLINVQEENAKNVMTQILS